ncbi:phage tail tape measure protein [Klebsiella oxytoca]|uniref:phage tail tape measure protein n=1 Tax=Klebsiella oxytoca TaxID=571 RepID=UPI0022468ED3|nr:phage tail tape measure protein [Klebsiella oxytoca]MCW9589618.1 phage tail tape measure protein [Klebsiella oxytoca]MCW9600885.1 phage tail tape measure protein [Klebsiella oxytoca]MCW9623779.1 phage tail tape measure protein [Klebsiella oxytoca]
MKSLDIRVAFSAIDRFTRPVNAARQSAGGLSDSLRKTQSALKGLDKSSATFQRMTAAVGKTDRSISRARARFDGLSEAQRKNGTLTERQQTLMARLGERLDRLSAKRVTEVARLRESASALRQHGVMLSGSSATISNAIRRTDELSRSLEREKAQLAAVTQARKRYEGAQQMAGKLRTGGALAVGTATAAGYGAGRFLSPAVGFDEEMSNVQALTRLDKGDSQLAALRAQAKKLGAETAFTTRDAASGQAFLAMAGFTPDAIRDALPGVLNMALAGGMDLGASADIGSNILSQFSLDAGEMDRVSDVLTGTFTRTNTTLSSLGETMKVVGPVAAGLGINLEEAAAMTGTLARVGIRGSEAGTAMRRSLSRLASPTTAAKKALKELGVETADASGKMRRPFDILLDLQKKASRFGDVDQISFFKDIAGEEGFTGLQSLVSGAGDGYLQSLYEQIAQAHKNQEANTVAKVKTNNLGGNLKELDSAWEAFRISVAETVDGPLRRLTQGLSHVIGNIKSWVEENPRLAKTLFVAGGVALALTAAVGGLSLAAGLLLGPLAKLRLGFALLSGGGIGGALSAFRALSAVGGSSLAKFSGWRIVFGSITAHASAMVKSIGALGGRLTALTGVLAPVRGALLAAFVSPGAALGSLAKGIGGLALRLTGLPALFKVVRVGFSALGGGLSLLLSPIGLLGAAFVAAAVLIWKYWGPIKAFFAGVFTGLMQGLAPLRAAFAGFAPVFGLIGDGVKKVWSWFKKLLVPVEQNRETLNKCASVGERFGRVLAGALGMALTPAKALLSALTWILEKLGVLPDETERVRKKLEEAQRTSLLQEKLTLLQGDIGAITPKKAEVPKGDASSDEKPLTGDKPLRRLGEIADNTKGLLDEEKRKRVGPGDIVFKNLPPALAVRGEWQESRLVRQSVSARPIIAAGEPVVLQAPALKPVRRDEVKRAAAAAQGGVFSGEIHVHLHDVRSDNPRELARLVGEAVRAEMDKQRRAVRGSFRDND